MKIKLCASPNSAFNHIQVDELATLCGWIIKEDWITDIPYATRKDGLDHGICKRCQRIANLKTSLEK